ncbi:DMT family transporter [Neptunomonas antarctica]|uniref:Permease of the drug/metabolite transporter (DMT) superfamily n=1 Tax=Neptunomonas antarctica TaxID=619304 RepID=A0A1N7KXE2_9GAMM|nr:DMT family transporter [Neptunomonas antarctica]SIS66146.1 Permease of the drug/metabolite transporter (DMT) superfamily [Neptunomonas antarctica]
MDNTRGSLYMVLAMAAFAIEDMFIKASANTMPIGLILMLFGLGGTLIFILLAWQRKEQVLQRAILSRPLLIRAGCEVIGRLCFALAITLTPLSSASAILQATPLVVVLGGAIIFGERVGLMRWVAILVGFTGVLMVIRPGMDSFNPASLFAVISTLGFAGRDLATRAAPPLLSNIQLGVYGFFVLIPTGLIVQLYSGESLTVNSEASIQIIGAIAFGVVAYNSLTIAMRNGAISVVTPFRYTRLLFALILGVIIFDERPDLMTLTGALIVVGSGVFTLFHSRRIVSIKP